MQPEATIAIMCGGRGRRLGKLTEERPKPLVELNGKTILEWKLEHYGSRTLKNTILCVGYQGDKIVEYIKPKFKQVNFHDSGEQSGILKRLADVKDQLLPLSIVTYGDTFAKLELELLLKKHIENEVLITLVVAPITNPFGILEWNEKKIITRFEEKPVINHFIGYFVISREVFDYIPQQVVDMADGEGIVTMFQIMIAMKKAKVYEFNGLKFTINTPSELEDAKKKMGDFFTLDEGNNER